MYPNAVSDPQRKIVYSCIPSEHSVHILKKLQEQYDQGRNCDLDIRVKGKQLYVHKFLVDIFMPGAGAELENDRFYLDLREYDPSVIIPLVDMMYTGELSIIPHQVDAVFRAAQELGFRLVQKGCTIYKRSFQNDNEAASSSATPVKTEPADVPETSLTETNSLIKINTGQNINQDAVISPFYPYNSNMYKTTDCNTVSSSPISSNVYQVIRIDAAGKPGTNPLKETIKKARELIKQGSTSQPKIVPDSAIQVTAENWKNQHEILPYNVVTKTVDGAVVKGRETSQNTSDGKSTNENNTKKEAEDSDGAEKNSQNFGISKGLPITMQKEKIYPMASKRTARKSIKDNSSNCIQSTVNFVRSQKKKKTKVVKECSVKTENMPASNSMKSNANKTSTSLPGLVLKTASTETDEGTPELRAVSEHTRAVSEHTRAVSEHTATDTGDDCANEREGSRGTRSLRAKRRVNYSQIEETYNNLDESDDEMKIRKSRNSFPPPKKRKISGLDTSTKYQSSQKISQQKPYSSSKSKDTKEKYSYSIGGKKVDVEFLRNPKERRFSDDGKVIEDLKYFPPAGVVPQGCRSSYGTASFMKTKRVTETITHVNGSITVVTKEVPVRPMIGPTLKKYAAPIQAKEPMYVLCHPTAPVVKKAADWKHI